MFCRLFSLAPFISMKFLNFLRFLGTEISKSPLYLAVRKLISKFHQKYLEQLILHQRNQLGPISMIISAAFIISSSCSTTIKLPSDINTFINRSVSLGVSQCSAHLEYTWSPLNYFQVR
jgi:hypothetical protein